MVPQWRSASYAAALDMNRSVLEPELELLTFEEIKVETMCTA